MLIKIVITNQITWDNISSFVQIDGYISIENKIIARFRMLGNAGSAWDFYSTSIQDIDSFLLDEEIIPTPWFDFSECHLLTRWMITYYKNQYQKYLE